MRRSELSKDGGPARRPILLLAAVAICLPLAAGAGDGALTREGARWVQVTSGKEKMPAAGRLRVISVGPVSLQGGVSPELAYTVKVSVRARNEAEARRRLADYRVRVLPQGESMTVTVSGVPAQASLILRTPRLREAAISTSEGPVDVEGIDGTLVVEAGGGPLKADGIRGNCTLRTGGSEIRVGRVDGALHCATGGGAVTAHIVGGDAQLETGGGDIAIDECGGHVQAKTVAGAVHIGSAGGPVEVVTGGGRIAVDRAGGVVTVRNVAGPVQVGAASGVHCQCAGVIRLNNIAGGVQVSTPMGSIMASLLAGKLSDSFLTTGNGDITVMIPSNLGLTVQAEDGTADTLRRIVSEFPGIPVRMQGTRVVAEGAINGGGPLLRISNAGGTIFIRRQQ